MGRDDEDGFADYNDLLRTQVYKIELCLRWRQSFKAETILVY